MRVAPRDAELLQRSPAFVPKGEAKSHAAWRVFEVGIGYAVGFVDHLLPVFGPLHRVVLEMALVYNLFKHAIVGIIDVASQSVLFVNQVFGDAEFVAR